MDWSAGQRRSAPPLPAMPTLLARLDVEGLLKRSAYLSPRDRLLLDLSLKLRLTHRQIAAAMQIPRGSVSRRVRRLLRRLDDPVAVAITDPTCPLPADLKLVARRVLIEGLPATAVARQLHQSPATVRAAVGFVRGWFRGLREAGEWERQILRRQLARRPDDPEEQ